MKPERRRSMRCKSCKSLNTIKNGSRRILPVSNDRHTTREVQRYYCKECGKTFSIRKDRKKKYTTNFKIELVRMHMEERSSYRVISKRIKEKLGKKISPWYICKMVNEITEKTKGSIAIKEEYKPEWEGYLTVDDKYINIKGKKQLSLVAVDSSGDPLHAELIKEPSQSSYDEFMLFIKERLNYPVKAVTTDLDEMLTKSIETVMGSGIKHQQCLKHAIETIKKMMEYQQIKRKTDKLDKKIKQLSLELKDRKQSYITKKIELEHLKKEYEKIYKIYQQKEEVLKLVNKIFYSEGPEGSEKYFEKIKNKYSKDYQIVINFIDKHRPKLLMYHQDKNIPKTNNKAENINKQLKRRFKTIEAFQSYNTAFNYLNLLKNYLRFKAYTDCKGSRKNRNGKSPLEICGVVLTSRDWLTNSISL